MKMNEERCNITLRDDEILGWKVRVQGCDELMKKIEGHLGSYGWKYFISRVEFPDKTSQEHAAKKDPDEGKDKEKKEDS